MINGRKIVIVMPGFNAAKTIQRTYHDIPFDIVDEVVLVDDGSTDDTVATAKALGIKHIVVHNANRGYGANQKSCYSAAFKLDADIVVMLHPDYQYTPLLTRAMCSLIADDVYPVVLGSRILGNGALKGGMPLYKYVFNRLLTLVQNFLMGQKLSEYHTGYRAFDVTVLKRIDFLGNSDDFVFDNELLAQIFMLNYSIAEITCPTRYFDEASSINFYSSIKYGIGVLRVAFQYRLHKMGIKQKLFIHA